MTNLLPPEQEFEFRRIIQTVLDKKLDPIETAREFGVDIEQLRHMRQLNPTTRLRYLDAMAEFLFIGRAAIHRAKEQRKHGHATQIH
jgi:hypothetical protein